MTYDASGDDRPDPTAGDALRERFETIYRDAGTDPGRIPWAKRKPNPLLTDWLERERPVTRGLKAIVVGCGLGDDAELLSRWGFEVTAFDIAPTAISWCLRRFERSTRVKYQSADLTALPPGWVGAWDFVFESYTLQALPADSVRPAAAAGVASLVKPGGRLLLIARGRDEDETIDGPPWPLTQREIGEIAARGGLRVESFEDLLDHDRSPPIRRFRAAFVRDC